MTPPVAHAGHWLSSVIYIVPIALVALALLRDRIKNGPVDDRPSTRLDQEL